MPRRNEEKMNGSEKGDDEDERGLGVRDRDEEGEETRAPRVGRIPIAPPRKSWKHIYSFTYLTKSGLPYASRARAYMARHGERLMRRRTSLG